MKNKNIIYLAAVVLIVTSGITACKKFLNPAIVPLSGILASHSCTVGLLFSYSAWKN